MLKSRTFFCLSVLIAAVGWAAAAEAAEPIAANQVRDFLRRYCIACHGPAKQQGERRFDQLALSLPAADEESLLDLQDIVDQLTLEEMPPESAKQPTVEERLAAIESLTATLAQARSQQTSTGGRPVLRRLNRREYLNTIGDLLDIDMSMFDPTTRFPRDNIVDGLDNAGDALVTSGYLLEQYLEAADRIVEKAFAIDQPPQQQTWRFTAPFQQQPELDPAHRHAFDLRYLCLYDCPQAERPEGAYGPLQEFHGGVPLDGTYEIKVLAQAMNRDTPYEEKHLKISLDEPFRMGIVPGDSRIADQHTIQPIQPLLAETIIKDGDPQWYTLTVHLDAGFAPRFTFPNGMAEVRPTYGRLMRFYRDRLPKPSRDAKGIFEERKALIRDGLIPHIRIHEVDVRGPLETVWPPASQRAVLGDQPFDAERMRPLISRFASRAFRRPARDDEIDRLMQLVEQRRAQGHSPLQAFKDALKTVLCSPAFLYLQPVEGEQDDAARNFAIASRLSYFLWASMPDERLTQLAESGEIAEPGVLRSEVRRLLSSPKSDAMVDGFLDSWLNLRALGEMPPDRQAFEQYYARGLEDEMREETRRFMRHLIDDNRSILDFLAADYSFVNRDLAKLYEVADQVPADRGHQFQQIYFRQPYRGGLLGQASVLTVTANGIETSPVTRGVWLLENILGTPPAPPPDDVPAIDPDVRGATSIRDLLAKHRSTAACNGCHRKIDPLGFALESFDPIGGWRTRYDNKAKIDTSGELPGGQSFEDVAGLKRILLERESFFARLLTQKLLEYAIGRRLEPLDRPAVENIADALAKDNYPLRTLIEEVVASDLFCGR